MLMAEARIHSHDQHLIQIGQNFFQHRRRSCGIDRHSGATSETLNALNRTVQVIVAFPVNEK